MKDTYKKIMMNKFQVDFNINVENGYVHYIKDDGGKVIIYKWENCLVYRAPYKCISSSTRTLEEACRQVESKCMVKEKHEEYNLFTEQINIPIVEAIEIRELTLKEEVLLEEMQEQCAQSDREVAEISIHDIYVLGAFINGKLVGVSSLLDVWGAYDIGVLVHPQYRRQKISTYLVAKSASWIISKNKVCMYRCDADNIGSYKTALGLGFQKKVDIIAYKLEGEVKK